MATSNEMLNAFTDLLESGGSFVVAGLGDSLTFGWMVGRGFFDRFCDGLEDRFAQAVLKRLNAGVPGDTAEGGLLRIGEVLASNPDLLVIQFGLNDMAQALPVGAFEENIDELVTRALQWSTVPLLVTSCPLVKPVEQMQATLYYDAVRQVADRRSVPLADLDAHWRTQSGRPNKSSDLYLADGIHPSDEGHAIMAEGLLALVFRDTLLCPPPF